MNKIKITNLFFLLILVCTCNTKQGVSNVHDIVFKNVNLIPMTEEKIIEKISVYISDGKIVAIAKFDDLKFQKNSTIINAEDKYLLPGFSDMHIHLFQMGATEQANLYLANGVTLVRVMFGNPEILKFKKMIRAGKILGPEIFTTGPLIDGKRPFWPGSFILDRPEDVASAIQKMKEQGYDAIKVYDKISLKVYDQIMIEAKKQNIPVVGHVPYSSGLLHVINSGQHSIEHFTGYTKFPINKEQIKATIESGIWKCPTLVILFSNDYRHKAKEFSELAYIPPEFRNMWMKTNPYSLFFDQSKKILDTLYKNGANIVSGTDAGNPFTVPGFSLHREFEFMNEAGLTPYQVLLTTTVNPARMLGISDRLGTIEEGKDADLVLLEKNPLEDIRNTRSIDGVMSKGTWLSKKTQQKMLKKIEDKYKE